MPLKNSPVRIAVCFYGIARSLRFTHSSIEDNILAPLRALGDVKVYAHFYRKTRIENQRSGEFCAIDPREHKYLNYDFIDLDEPDNSDVQSLFDAVAPFGSAWTGDMTTLGNLCHQLISLRQVTQRALSDGHDLYVFVRPDLMYHDSILHAARVALNVEAPHVFTPDWQQQRGGLNDRFCLVRGDEAARAVGYRADNALNFCSAGNAPLHSELLLRFSVKDIPEKTFFARATRVRSDGIFCRESFDVPHVADSIRKLRAIVRQPGVRSVLIRLLRLKQRLQYGPRYDNLHRLAALSNDKMKKPYWRYAQKLVTDVIRRRLEVA